MGSSWKAVVLSALLSLGITSGASADDRAAAAATYAQAEAAEVGGRLAEAATLYQAAFHLAPHPVALRAVARTRLALGQSVLAAEAADSLITLYGDDTRSRVYGEEVLAQVRPQVGRLAITCEGSCAVAVDGEPAPTLFGSSHVLYALVGPRTIAAQFGPSEVRTETRSIDVVAGTETQLTFAAPIKPCATHSAPIATPLLLTVRSPDRAPPERRGIARGYTLAVAAAAVGLGGGAIWAGLETRKAARSYDRTPEGDAETRIALARYERGERLERRTNTLLGLTTACAVAALVMATFTDWGARKREPRGSLAVFASPTGAQALLTQRF